MENVLRFHGSLAHSNRDLVLQKDRDHIQNRVFWHSIDLSLPFVVLSVMLKSSRLCRDKSSMKSQPEFNVDREDWRVRVWSWQQIGINLDDDKKDSKLIGCHFAPLPAAFACNFSFAKLAVDG